MSPLRRWDFVPAGTTKGLSDRPLETFGHPLINRYLAQHWQVAAALSAAVTTSKQQGNRTHSQVEPSQKQRTPPIASRASGERVWGGGERQP